MRANRRSSMPRLEVAVACSAAWRTRALLTVVSWRGSRGGGSRAVVERDAAAADGHEARRAVDPAAGVEIFDAAAARPGEVEHPAVGAVGVATDDHVDGVAA